MCFYGAFMPLGLMRVNTISLLDNTGRQEETCTRTSSLTEYALKSSHLNGHNGHSSMRMCGYTGLALRDMQ